MQGKLHQYHLTTELAQKYSHVTYLASPTDEPEHQVILTVLASSLFSLPHEREHVLQKAQRIQEIEHPNLVPILDMGIEDEQPFVVREYLPHDSLRSRLRTLSPDHLELRDALMIISQIGQALAYAHKHRIFHGNLKPENIFFDANGQAVLTDFSLVDRKDAILRDQTTEEYAFCYLAPEQFAGTSDARSDQYALGCLAYELITGQAPFVAQTLASMMGLQSNARPASLSESVAGLSPTLETAILKTLAKDPAERFFDFSLFLEIIQSVLPPPPAFPLLLSAASRKQRTTSGPTRRPKARMFLSSAVSPSPTPQSLQAETIQQSEERIPMTTKGVFDADQTDTKFYISQKTTNDGTRKSSIDRVRKPRVGEISFSESQSDLDQTLSQEDADDLWLTNPFEEQERNDLPAKGSASLGQEQHKPGSDTRDKMIVSLHGDRPVSRRTQPNRSKVFGLVLLCIIIVASGTYAAFFLSRTSKPDSLVRPTQVVNQVLIPVQNSISPTQPPTPMATVQPTPPIRTIPMVILTPTPIPTVITTPPPTSYEAELSQNTLSGSAQVIGCSSCSGGSRVGYIGLQANRANGTLQFNNINKNIAGNYTMTIYYTNGDTVRGTRTWYISVNGGSAITLNGAFTGSFDTVGTANVMISLKAGNNTIAFFNSQKETPDIDKIVV